MLNRLPKLIMPLSTLLDDIGNPKAGALAKSFRVPEKAAAKWIKDDEAPLPVMLALFWLTRWGHQAVDCEAHNAAIMQAGVAACLRREVASLTGKLARLGKIADFGCANDPAPGVALPHSPSLRAAEKPAEPADATGKIDLSPSGATDQSQINRAASRAAIRAVNRTVDQVSYRPGLPRGRDWSAGPINTRAAGQTEGEAT